jgi:hypothetical protein
MPIVPFSSGDVAAVLRANGLPGIFPIGLGFNPYTLPNIAARYSLDGAPGDSTWIMDGSNRLVLVADRSGNSAENCLVLNGASGNYASTPDSAALDITGDIDIRIRLAYDDWTPSGTSRCMGKYAASNGNRSWLFGITSAGLVNILWSPDGINTVSESSTVSPVISDMATAWLRVTLDVDNGAGAYEVIFYTSPDGITWTKLGTTKTGGGTTSINNSPSVVTVGSGDSSYIAGRVYRAQIYSGINGTLVFDANFTLPAKLATSFTESSSNAATVTINSTGDLGARICGARDLYQATSGKQFIISTAGDGKTIATADGINDFMKSPPFPLVQPETVYLVGSQESWATNDVIFDGDSLGTMRLIQNTSSPNLQMTAGASGPATTALATATRAVISACFNGASSTLRINRGSAATGNVGSSNAGGFIVGASGTPGNYSNITVCEPALIFSAAHDEATQLRIADYFMRKWNVS